MQRIKARILCGLCILILAMLAFPSPNSVASDARKNNRSWIIVIDPGHGGENNGTEECGFLEKDMTLKTALVMAEELKKFDGVEVYLTRYDDQELSLKDRAKIAEKYNADFLISLHYNASESHKLFGSEVWISLIPEYHNPGYQLGTMFLREFRDMGLTLRGIKTKRHSKGNDYYGILRETVNLGIPAIIVEHCHVDHPADNVYCDSDEELEAFGLADARAVAKYYGLKSQSLGIDYAADRKTLPEVTPGKLVERATQDQSIPTYCNITVKEVKYDEDLVTVEVSASDPESNLIYYSYSFDGGLTFCDSIPWPEGDILTGEFEGRFTVEIEVPDNTRPKLCFRATNPYDLDNDSNVVTFDQVFHKPEPTPEPSKPFVDGTANLLPENEEKETWADLSGSDKMIRAIQVGIVFCAILFIFFLLLYVGKSGKNSKKKK
ncbi:MAG: N-acetylmuramoyl-L-alanine amidase [Lachnospiraceae bacterium]|nr:N-acetylmuramoyl-L-alanine amidase [Lachnospiraceae bacterium]